MSALDRLEAWVYRNKVLVAFELGILALAVYLLYALLMIREEREIAAAEASEASDEYAPDGAPEASAAHVG